MLDITFCEENILVDGVFPEKNAAIRVHKLLSKNFIFLQIIDIIIAVYHVLGERKHLNMESTFK